MGLGGLALRLSAASALLAALGWGLSGCTSSATGSGGAGAAGGTTGQAGSSGTRVGTAPEGASCNTLVSNFCAPPMECVSMGATGRCAETCQPPHGSCPGNGICVPQYDDPSQGYCAERRNFYDTCESGDGLSACGHNAYCASLITAQPDRCVPVCKTGTLGSYTTVPSCPALPAALGGQATECMPITIGEGQGSLCSREVEIFAECDQVSRRCNLGDEREDTAPGLEPTAPGELDPGALACLPQGPTGAFCLRVCSIDGGATEAPCECPAGDDGCTDPTDPGVAWSCVGSAHLPADVRICAQVEDCSNDAAACDNNAALTACLDSPFTTGPSKICGAPQ